MWSESGGGGGATFTGKYATYREEGGVYVQYCLYIYTVSERVLQWVEKGSAGIQYIERKGGGTRTWKGFR